MAPTLTSEAWTQIRFDYEHSERPIAEICAEHGISSGTLRDRMRRWGWARRRPPIPREGPPPLPAPVEMRAVASMALPLPTAQVCDEALSDLDQELPHPAHKGEGQVGDRGATCASAALPVAAEDAAPSEIDDGALVPRLKGAVARVLPAIEAIVARLATGTTHPREMERAGRALGALTRTLRELNALLGERRPPAPANDPAGSGRSGEPADDDEGPRDMEAFRLELIRRMNAVVAARIENAEGHASAEGGANAGSDTSPSRREAQGESAPPPGPHVRPL